MLLEVRPRTNGVTTRWEPWTDPVSPSRINARDDVPHRYFRLEGGQAGTFDAWIDGQVLNNTQLTSATTVAWEWVDWPRRGAGSPPPIAFGSVSGNPSANVMVWTPPFLVSAQGHYALMASLPGGARFVLPFQVELTL